MNQIPKENDIKNSAFDQLLSCVSKGQRANRLDLREINLSEAVLSALEADQLDLSLANLRGVNFLKVRLGSCNFSQSKINNTVWKESIVRMCLFDSSQGLNACFDEARIEDNSMKGANLKGASFLKSKLTETTFERSVMQECIFHGAEGDGVVFRGADLRNASFNQARFNDADFRGADLRNADLSNGHFRNADFRGALLAGAIFEGINCSGAIFDADAMPYASSTDKKDRRADELGNAVVTLLGDSLADLTGVLTNNDAYIRDVTNRLQRASNALNDTFIHSPEEWQQWTELILSLAKNEQAVDLETIVKTLCEGPVELQNLFALNEVFKDEMLERVQHLSETLNSATDEPPDEWKPILEPLINKTKRGEALDLKSLIELLNKIGVSGLKTP